MKGDIFCVLITKPEEKTPIYNRFCFIGNMHFPGIWLQHLTIWYGLGRQESLPGFVILTPVGTTARSPWSPSFPNQGKMTEDSSLERGRAKIQ